MVRALDVPTSRMGRGPASRCAGVQLSFLLMRSTLPPTCPPAGERGTGRPGESVPGLQERPVH